MTYFGHRGIWATYNKIKERYWWKGLYKYVENFVAFCIECQVQSKVCYINELHPTYPLAMHFQWVINLVAIPSRMWDMKYLILAKKKLSNFVEGTILGTKSTKGVCRFILEDIFSKYGTIDRMKADQGEVDAAEARSFLRGMV